VLEKNLLGDGIPDPVPRKLMDGMYELSGGYRDRGEQIPRFRRQGKRVEKNLFLL
jgi:hypothetical protein